MILLNISTNEGGKKCKAHLGGMHFWEEERYEENIAKRRAIEEKT